MTVLIILLLAAAAAAWVLMQPTSQAKSGARRVTAKALLTPNEREFYRRLLAALPQHVVLTQVAMGALMQPTADKAERAFRSTRGLFSQKIVDFVVLNDKLEVVTLIELDDRTHNKLKDAQRDRLTGEAGYVTLRYESKAKPSVEQLRTDVLALGDKS